ncbi:MAG: zinc ribbon domain-containing protein [bacterium]
MKCPQCGAENPVNRLYCDACGAELEHDLAEIQATVDREVRDERAKAVERNIRWFLVASLLLAVVGYSFRRAYRSLPENELVAFAAAPIIEVDDSVVVGTLQFGVPLEKLPQPARTTTPIPLVVRTEAARELAEEAYRQRAVVVKLKGVKRSTEGLLTGDIVLRLTPAGSAEPLYVHIAQVRAIRPVGEDEWEFQVLGREDPVRARVEDPGSVRIGLLVRRDGEVSTQKIALPAIEKVQPL